jgi:cytochrome c5
LFKFYYLLFFVSAAGASTCPTLKESELSYQTVRSMIQNEACGVRTITDVIKRLPESYREQYVAFFRSRSLQGPYKDDYKNPRVLVFGNLPKSNLVMTFNGNPNDAGNLGLEFAEINTKGDKDDLNVFKYYEIQFPLHEDKVKDKPWAEVQKGMTFSEANPDRCVRCHGNPARPIYPGYPLWEGSFGSAHTMEPPESERAGLAEHIAIIKSPTPSRYSSLGDGMFKHSYPSNYWETFEMANDQFNQKIGTANAVQVSRLALRTPDYSKYRYAIMGAFLRCNDFESFVPEGPRKVLLKNIENQYSLKEKWPSTKELAYIHEVYTAKNVFLQFQMGFINGKKGPFPEFAKKFRQDMGGSSEFQWLQFDTFSMQGQVRADPLAANLRLLMEGRGIDINKWYLDLTQPTYRYHNGAKSAEDTVLAMIQNDPSIDRKVRESFQRHENDDSAKKNDETCEELRKLSQKDLADVKVQEIPRPKDPWKRNAGLENSKNASCEPNAGLEHQAIEFASIANKCMDSGYPSVFTNTCYACHDSATKIAPSIPFTSPAAMKKWLATGNNRDLLKGKIKSTDETVRMPPTRKLTDQEKSQILNFIEAQ